MVICLERGADLHMAQLMPLPLTVSCFSKIQIGFTFLVPAHMGSPGKGPLNGCCCSCSLNRIHIIKHTPRSSSPTERREQDTISRPPSVQNLFPVCRFPLPVYESKLTEELPVADRSERTLQSKTSTAVSNSTVASTLHFKKTRRSCYKKIPRFNKNFQKT